MPPYTAIHKESQQAGPALPSVEVVGRRIDAENLVGATEIAERLGVARAQTVHVWATRYEDFPKPVAQLKQAFVWNWPDVAAWAKATGRLRSQ